MTMVPSPHAPFRLSDFSVQTQAFQAPKYAHDLSLFVTETNCPASDLTVDHMDGDQDALSTSRDAAERYLTRSCSRDFREDENWLRLGVDEDDRRGGGAGLQPMPRKLVELDLLSGKSTAPNPPPSVNVPRYFMHPPPPLYLQRSPHGLDGFPGFRQQEYVWNFRQQPYSSIPWNLPPHPALRQRPSSAMMKMGEEPPIKPNSGLWFVLQAEENQIKELVLPQVQKSYLRIKDGKMTIFLIMKYLANKLRLSSESEVEITCRGKRILPSLTLEHVRDVIWCPREQRMQEPAPDSPATDHVMILNYARSGRNLAILNHHRVN